MMQTHLQTIPRTSKLDNNLKEQVDWLTGNFEKAYFSGFNYAHLRSVDISSPIVFNFDNPGRRASNNSTLASISEIGDFELQSFRLNSSLTDDVQSLGKGVPSASSGWTAPSSSSSSVQRFSSDGNDGPEELEQSGSNNYDNDRRPSVGSFLGSSKAFSNSDRNYSSSSRSSNGNQVGGGPGSSYGGDSSSSSSYRGDNTGMPRYPNCSNNSGNNNSSSSSNNSNNSNNYSSSGSTSTALNIAHPPNSSYQSYSMDVSDSQLAVMDIEAIVQDAQRRAAAASGQPAPQHTHTAPPPPQLTETQRVIEAEEALFREMISSMEAQHAKLESLRARSHAKGGAGAQGVSAGSGSSSSGSSAAPLTYGGTARGTDWGKSGDNNSSGVGGVGGGGRQGGGSYMNSFVDGSNSNGGGYGNNSGNRCNGNGNGNDSSGYHHQQEQQQGRMTNSWDETPDAVALRSSAAFRDPGYNDRNCEYWGGGGGGGGNGQNNSAVWRGGNYDNSSSSSNNYSNNSSNNGGYSIGGGYAVSVPSEPFVTSADTKDHHNEMKNVFGHNGFREGQRECVEAALGGRDVFCLMPTGGGKSVVYQLPAWCSPGLSVIFSPLISLIQDQVDSLTAIGIRAVFMSSTQDDQEGRQVFQDLWRYDAGYRHSEDSSGEMEKRIKMLYITPERFAKSEGLKKVLAQLYAQGMLSRFVIDEAHCLSQWGHDFRPDYLALTQIRGLYPRVPIMCLTATANQKVVGDSIAIMGMRDSYKHTMSFNRTNLHYSVRKKEGTDKLIKSIAQTVRARGGLTGIVYCLSKMDTETVANALRAEIPSMKNQITFYHADVAPDEKEKRQRSWSKGTIKVICATIAFGMGINKPDVRYVIHHSVPKSLTNYYQESGRAGRDGGIAECIMYFSYKDKGKLAAMIQRSKDEKNRGGRGNWKANNDNASLGMDNLHKCVSFCLNDTDCRRVLLLEYFGETFPRHKCKNTCDNCIRVSRGEVDSVDMTGHALLTIRLVADILGASTSRGGGLTLTKMSKILSGSRDKDTAKFEAGVTRVRSACVGNYSKSGGRSYQTQGGNSSPTPLPPVPPGTLTKDLSERLLQHMVLQGLLDEVSVENGSGFNADYLEAGAQERVDAIEQGREKMVLSVRQKGWGGEVLGDAVLVPKRKGADKDKEGGSSYLDMPDSAKKKGAKDRDEDGDGDEGWLSSGIGGKAKSKRPVGAKGGRPAKAAAGTGIDFDTTPPEVSSYRSQYSSDDPAARSAHTSKPPTAPAGKGFKVPTKVAAPSAASVYGSSASRTKDSPFGRSVQQEKGGTRRPPVTMAAGTGRAVTVKGKRQSDSSADMDMYSDGDGGGDGSRSGSIEEESDVEAIDDYSSLPKRGGAGGKGTKGGLPSSVTKRVKGAGNRSKAFGVYDSSSESDDLSASLGRTANAGERDRGAGGQGKGKGKKRVRASSDTDDPDDAERDRDGDRGREAATPCLLSPKKQAAFLAWIDTFRRQWDGYWNKLPEVSITLMKKKPPVTRAELASVDGMGESRVNISGEAILATIYAFLEVHDLLHLFPHAVAPTLAESPLWRDPMSEEAYSMRKALTDAEKSRTAVRAPRPVEDLGGGGGGGSATWGVPHIAPTKSQVLPPSSVPFPYSVDAIGADSGTADPGSEAQTQHSYRGIGVGVGVGGREPYAAQSVRKAVVMPGTQPQQHPYSNSPYSAIATATAPASSFQAASYQSTRSMDPYGTDRDGGQGQGQGPDEGDPLQYMS